MTKSVLDEETYNKIVNKLASVADKFLEIEAVVKTINIWVKENDYELIPIVKILNAKMKDASDILAK